MLTLVRTAQTMPGKIGDAIAFGKEVAPMIKRVTGAELEISVSFGGVVGEMAFMSHYDNAGKAEEATGKLLADREYVTAIGKAVAAGLFVPGSVRDQMWRRV